MLQLVPGGFLKEVLDDSAPVLGGNLAAGGYDITNVGLGSFEELFAQALDVNGDVTSSGAGEFASLDITDETVGYQIDGTSIMWTGDPANYNMFLGEDAFGVDEGNKNVGIGYQAGMNNDASGGDGWANVYIGYQAGKGYDGAHNTRFNVGIGVESLTAIKGGDYNVGLGSYTLRANTVGHSNMAIGYGVLLTNVGGDRNVGVGMAALYFSTGNDNMAIGAYALYRNTSGHRNIGIGSDAVKWNQTGLNNIGIGRSACGGGGTVVNNCGNMTCIGAYAGGRTTTSDSGIYLGYNAGFWQTTVPDLLLIDNVRRIDAAEELTNAIIYGVMAALPANQDLTINANVFLSQVKSGDTQANAGAAANEVWKTSAHATLPDNVLMIGV